MSEYKSLTFMIVDHKGFISKITFDVEEGCEPHVSIKGDTSILRKRWSLINTWVQHQLQEHDK